MYLGVHNASYGSTTITENKFVCTLTVQKIIFKMYGKVLSFGIMDYPQQGTGGTPKGGPYLGDAVYSVPRGARCG
jgi:hypothetical protein